MVAQRDQWGGREERDRKIWALVRRQHGVVAHRQLLELGLARSSIRWRVKSGRLHPVRRGVYAVGRPHLDRHGHLATQLSPRQLERAVNEADKLDRVRADVLHAALIGYRGSPGVARLRALLDPLVFRLSDSDLELLLRPLAQAAGLPTPETKAWVNGYEVDFFWPELGIVVETDGLRYHRTPSQQTRGLRRDQAHQAAGMRPLRFSHWQVKHEPAYVQGVLARTAMRARAG